MQGWSVSRFRDWTICLPVSIYIDGILYFHIRVHEDLMKSVVADEIAKRKHG